MGHAPLLYDELSGMENLRYFAGLYGLHDDGVWRSNAMQMVGLDPGAVASRRAVFTRDEAAPVAGARGVA